MFVPLCARLTAPVARTRARRGCLPRCYAIPDVRRQVASEVVVRPEQREESIAVKRGQACEVSVQEDDSTEIAVRDLRLQRGVVSRVSGSQHLKHPRVEHVAALVL